MATKDKDTANQYRSMAYDDAFQTIAQECKDVLIYFVNEMFGERYSLKAKVEHLRNEHYDQNRNKPTEKRITDSRFRISTKRSSEIYHLECESKGYGEEILIRMFRYNVSHAEIKPEGESPYKLTVELPQSGLLVLRDKGNPPQRMVFEIKTPNGSVSYEIPLIRMSDYSINLIFKKKMYLLVPFYFFNLEERMKYYNEDDQNIEEFEKIYCEILERIRKEDERKLSARSKGAIIKEMENVTKRLAYDKDRVVEKVGDIMGGKPHKLEWLEKYDAAVEKGRAEGRAEGEAERDKLRSEVERLKNELEKYAPA